MKNLLRKLGNLITMVSIFMLINISVFATDPNKDDVVAAFKDNFFIINVVTAIIVVIAFIVTAFELILHRKDEEERGKVIGGIPYIIAGVVIVGLVVQIVGRMTF